MSDQLEFKWEAPESPSSPPRLPDKAVVQVQSDALRDSLSVLSGYDIHLRITNNSSTMMSVRYDMMRRIARLNLHHMFLHAPPKVEKALAQWVKQPKSKRAAAVLNPYIADQQHLVQERAPRKQRQVTQGHHHDLEAYYAAVNAQEFGDEVDCPITWGRMPTQRRRRSIRFGSYTPGEHLIRIHPFLDQVFVPQYFVKYIVFHEMLHAHMGIAEGENGRRQIHPPAFKQREATYPDFERAMAWMNTERNLHKVLRTRPESLGR